MDKFKTMRFYSPGIEPGARTYGCRGGPEKRAPAHLEFRIHTGVHNGRSDDPVSTTACIREVPPGGSSNGEFATPIEARRLDPHLRRDAREQLLRRARRSTARSRQ